MLEITVNEVKEAFHRLKTHVYYDSSDLFIRRRLAEFETNLSDRKDIFSINNEYTKKNDMFSFDFGFTKNINEKFEQIANALNNNEKEFFDQFLEKMEIRYLPKKFKESELNKNFISNKRIQANYEVERASAFIDAPIELHLITVLWIMKYGKSLDSELSEHAYGNRLLLNQEKTELIKGSSLFKPYHKQYQKWRDRAVIVAKATLAENEDVIFFNLDIKDYYYSVNLNIKQLIENNNKNSKNYPFLLKVFEEIHIQFTQMLCKNSFPFNYDKRLKEGEVVLPIGLLSSYILGNYFLNEFDSKVIKELKPQYYGRYVDDILFVVKNPKCSKVVDLTIENNTAFEAENIIIEELGLLLEINTEKSILKIKGDKYSNLFCQSEKTLLYYFDHNESDLVIDKLKRDLDKRASEFRDFPDEDEDEDSAFEDSAYHLLYDGSEGKIKTLKDFKENRYGLSVYFSNKIFSALRHNKKTSHEESKKIIRFFRGVNCLEFYRLWEKIFTFYLVNDDSNSFVDFYVHAFQQIDKVKQNFTDKDVNLPEREVQRALLEYLDCALELVLSLNPYFVENNKKAKKKLEFFQNKERDWFSCLIDPFAEPTNQESSYITRFRRSNLVRHHYLNQSLISYTDIVYDTHFDLTSLKAPLTINDRDLSFSENAVQNSPRPVQFWECCLAVINNHLSKIQSILKEGKEDLNIDIFNLSFSQKDDEAKTTYLDEAIKLFQEINKIHFPDHIIDYDNIGNAFFKLKKNTNNTSCDLFEFHIDANNKLKNIKISFANTEVKYSNIESSIRGIPYMDTSRYKTFRKIFKTTREESANMLLLPENALPYEFLPSLVKYSRNNSIASVSGIEHIRVNNYCLNFIVSILPVKVNGVKDAVVIIRLKNHYSPGEKELIRGEHLYCPKPFRYRYDIINWRNLYFSPFYCFELADSVHRSIFRSKIDLLIASEWNKDTSYFSNIVEALTRDIHAYVAQVNTSHYGDSRLTKPSSSALKDILKLKGGKNDTILIGEIDLKSLRTFQRKNYNETKDDKEFKPLPPDFDYLNAIKREENKNIL